MRFRPHVFGVRRQAKQLHVRRFALWMSGTANDEESDNNNTDDNWHEACVYGHDRCKGCFRLDHERGGRRGTDRNHRRSGRRCRGTRSARRSCQLRCVPTAQSDGGTDNYRTRVALFKCPGRQRNASKEENVAVRRIAAESGRHLDGIRETPIGNNPIEVNRHLRDKRAPVHLLFRHSRRTAAHQIVVRQTAVRHELADANRQRRVVPPHALQERKLKAAAAYWRSRRRAARRAWPRAQSYPRSRRAGTLLCSTVLIQ